MFRAPFTTLGSLSSGLEVGSPLPLSLEMGGETEAPCEAAVPLHTWMVSSGFQQVWW